MKIGYARVSTHRQQDSLEAQQEALSAYGCEKIYSDMLSGAKPERPGLSAAIDYMRSEDSLVVTRLDRLGRSALDILRTVQELDARGIRIEALDTQLDTRTPAGKLVLSVLASMAEFERNLIVERTHEGLAHARAQGRTGGRPLKLTKEQQQAALKLLADGMSENQVAKTFSISRPTVSRLKRSVKSNL